MNVDDKTKLDFLFQLLDSKKYILYEDEIYNTESKAPNKHRKCIQLSLLAEEEMNLVKDKIYEILEL